MNCTPRRELNNPHTRRYSLGHFGRWRVLLGSYVAVFVLALLWVQPVAAQAVGPVYALPGTLTRAVNHDYDTILTIATGNEYGLVGQTPDIEAQIVEYRSQGAEFAVKVWGDRYAPTSEGELEIIVVSSIQPATPPTPETPTATPTQSATAEPTSAATTAPTSSPSPSATPLPPATPAVPVAVVTAANVNVRSGPGTEYPPVGNLVSGRTCTIVGRNQNATWWQLSCPGAVSGWVFGELLALAGPVSTVPVVQTAPPPTPAPPTTFNNWKSSFFANRDLAGTPVLVQDQPNINFNWGAGSPGAGVPADNFSARFERTLNLAFGTYELAITMDDGARVFVDDQLVIDDWNVGASRTRTVQQVLSGAKRFRIEYFEATGNAQLEFAVNLVSSSEAWQATYYNGTTIGTNPILTRGEPRSGSRQLDYNWGYGPPFSGGPADQFSARWVGTFNFEGGDYRFNANVDDGIRVYIDGILILDRWQAGVNNGVTNTFRALGAGNHQIVVEYFEDRANAFITVWWERLSSGGGGGGGSNPGRPRDE